MVAKEACADVCTITPYTMLLHLHISVKERQIKKHNVQYDTTYLLQRHGLRAKR